MKELQDIVVNLLKEKKCDEISQLLDIVDELPRRAAEMLEGIERQKITFGIFSTESVDKIRISAARSLCLISALLHDGGKIEENHCVRSSVR